MANDRAGDGVAAVKIQESLAVLSVDPDALAALSDDRHLLVSTSYGALQRPISSEVEKS